MAKTQREDTIRKLYNEKFDVQHYLGYYYNEVHHYEKTCMDQLYDIFETGKLKGPMKRCLEVGCGPVVYRMAPVSKVCDTIVYSDFSDVNKKAVKEWLEHDGPMAQHHNLFKYCAEKEGFQDIEEGVNKIEKRLKSKVKDVIHVDLKNPQPVGIVKESFDVALTFGCLESACLTYEDYVFAVKGIGNVLRPGGYLINRGFTDGDYYVVGEESYPCLNINVGLVSDALNEAGFQVLEISNDQMEEVRTNFQSKEREMSNLKGTLFALAQKI